MTTMEDKLLPPLETGVARGLADTVAEFLTKAAKASPSRIASSESKKLATRRVPPSWYSQCDTLDYYGVIVWDEAMTILDRILVYPFTTNYRRYLLDAPKDVVRAWLFHSHSLRVSELYVIQDRTVALLKFLKVIAEDLGLPATDFSRKFEKKFKETFKRHLLERHRLTHAHERPSMISRITEMAGAKWIEDGQEQKNYVENFLKHLSLRLIEAGELAGYSQMNTLEEVAELHEMAAQREARQMLGLFGESLFGTIKQPFVWSIR